MFAPLALPAEYFSVPKLAEGRGEGGAAARSPELQAGVRLRPGKAATRSSIWTDVPLVRASPGGGGRLRALRRRVDVGICQLFAYRSSVGDPSEALKWAGSVAASCWAGAAVAYFFFLFWNKQEAAATCLVQLLASVKSDWRRQVPGQIPWVYSPLTKRTSSKRTAAPRGWKVCRGSAAWAGLGWERSALHSRHSALLAPVCATESLTATGAVWQCVLAPANAPRVTDVCI